MHVKSLSTLRGVWFGLQIAAYLGYLVLFQVVGCGLTVEDPACFLLQSLLFAAPFYMIYLWTKRHALNVVDYLMIVLPFALWFAAFATVAYRKTMGNVVLEAAMVALLLGVYLLRFPIADQWGKSRERTIAVVFATVIGIGSLLVGWFTPEVPP